MTAGTIQKMNKSVAIAIETKSNPTRSHLSELTILQGKRLTGRHNQTESVKSMMTKRKKGL